MRCALPHAPNFPASLTAGFSKPSLAVRAVARIYHEGVDQFVQLRCLILHSLRSSSALLYPYSVCWVGLSISITPWFYLLNPAILLVASHRDITRDSGYPLRAIDDFLHRDSSQLNQFRVVYNQKISEAKSEAGGNTH